MESLLSCFCLVLISLIKVTSGKAACEEGWVYSPHTKYCYFAVSKPTPFNNAEIACLWKKANLASIHSEAENRLISEMAAKFGTPIWVGGAMFGSSRVYQNIDASPFDYTNWQNGTRPVYSKGRKCVKIDPKNRKWFDDCCFLRPVAYVCKKSTRTDVPYWHTIVEIPANAIKNTATIANNTDGTITEAQIVVKLSNSKFTSKSGNITVEHRETKDKAGDTVFEVVVKGLPDKKDYDATVDKKYYHTATVNKDEGFKLRRL